MLIKSTPRLGKNTIVDCGADSLVWAVIAREITTQDQVGKDERMAEIWPANRVQTHRSVRVSEVTHISAVPFIES